MSIRKIRKGDWVQVIAGKSVGQKGRVLSFPSEQKVLVSGINQVHKCVRANPEKEQEGGIKKQEAPIHISNIAIFNSEIGKIDRIGFAVIEEKKVRVYKSTGKPITDIVKE